MLIKTGYLNLFTIVILQKNHEFLMISTKLYIIYNSVKDNLFFVQNQLTYNFTSLRCRIISLEKTNSSFLRIRMAQLLKGNYLSKETLVRPRITPPM